MKHVIFDKKRHDLRNRVKDRQDYQSAMKVKQTNTVWHSHDDVKKALGIE